MAFSIDFPLIFEQLASPKERLLCKYFAVYKAG